MHLKSVFTILLFNLSLSISEDYYDLLGGYQYRIHPLLNLLFKNIKYIFFYFILLLLIYAGISRDADNREIRKAFKKLALKLHPDKERRHLNF